MKRILIIQGKEGRIGCPMVFPDTVVNTLQAEDLDDSEIDRSTILLLDLDSCSDEVVDYCAELARPKGAVIAAAGTVSDAVQRQVLLKYGIPFFIGREALEAHPESINALFPPPEKKGLAVLIDDDASRREIAETIFFLFGYRLITVTKPQDLFDLQESNDLIILHNLSMKDVDLMSFVRRGSDSQILKTMPYIAFKSGKEGVTLREIHSGIGRLTGYILSEEEVWSVIVYNLFRKELYSEADGFFTSIRMGENAESARDPIRKRFFSREANFFTGVSSLDAENILSSCDSLRSISAAMGKMMFLKWLIKDQSATNLTGIKNC